MFWPLADEAALGMKECFSYFREVLVLNSVFNKELAAVSTSTNVAISSRSSSRASNSEPSPPAAEGETSQAAAETPEAADVRETTDSASAGEANENKVDGHNSNCDNAGDDDGDNDGSTQVKEDSAGNYQGLFFMDNIKQIMEYVSTGYLHRPSDRSQKPCSIYVPHWNGRPPSLTQTPGVGSLV